MKIEFLYFEDCPHYSIALENLRASLNDLGINEAVELIRIESDADARKHRFLGSPSIRIDGNDLESNGTADTEYAMSCRRYRIGSDIVAYPRKEMIIWALKTAMF